MRTAALVGGRAAVRVLGSASLRADAWGRLRASSRRMRLRDEHRGLGGGGHVRQGRAGLRWATDRVVTMLRCAHLRRRCKEPPESMGEIIYVVRTSLLRPYVVHTSRDWVCMWHGAGSRGSGGAGENEMRVGGRGPLRLIQCVSRAFRNGFVRIPRRFTPSWTQTAGIPPPRMLCTL